MSVLEFLENGLKDNTIYTQNFLTKLETNQSGRKDSKNIRNLLLNTASDINNKVQEKEFRDKNLVTFGKEFEFADDLFFMEFPSIKGERLEDISIQTGNLVGKIHKKYGKYSYTIQINSRFGDMFLRYMLASTEGFLELERIGSYNKQGNIFWVLIYLWKSELKKAYQLGLTKLYQSRAEELYKLRGRIDINKHIQKSYSTGSYPCMYREHSYDNPVNRLIAYTLEYLLKEYSDLLSDIYKIKNVFTQSCNLSSFKLREANNIKITNPYYYRYKKVVKLSKLILNNSSMSLNNDENQFSAFLFDISMLFEHHIRKILLKERFRLAPKNSYNLKLTTGVEYKMKMIPDIIIETDDGICIFDVKYKHFNKVFGAKREDLYQLASYVSSWSSKERVKSCGFIYPCKEDEYEELQQFIKHSQKFDLFGQKINFHIILYKVSQKKEEFFSDMNKNTDDFVRQIKFVYN